MKPLIILGSLLLGMLVPNHAQSLDRFVIGTTGGEATSASFQLEFTAGESVVGTVESGSFTLNQGFNQSNPPYNTAIEPTLISVNYRLFPNPTTDMVHLEMELSEPAALRISCSDMLGRTVGERQLNISREQSLTWDLRAEANGVYLIQVWTTQGEPVKTFRVEKRS